MLFGENEFLKSTGMSKDELYAKIAKQRLLGVDFKIDEINKTLYKGQYYNRKTDEVFIGYFRLMHSEPNTIQLFFTDSNKQLFLVLKL